MRISAHLLIGNLLLTFIVCNSAKADSPELTSLHGTMIVMMSKDSGMPFEIWAKGNNVRSEFSAGDAKIISIQRGHIIYTFGEGSTSGTKQELHRGLGTLGLIRQIAEVKSHGEKQSSQQIDGEKYELYKYEVNAPFETAMVYLASETSLPRLWISILETADKSTQSMRMIFQNMEANVSIPDHMFESPGNVDFGESAGRDASPNAGLETKEFPRQLNIDESGLVVVISPAAKLMAGNEVLSRQRSGEVLKIVKEKGKWLLIRKVGGKLNTRGWIDRHDVISIGQASSYFSDKIDKNPQDANALFGRANLALFLAEYHETTQDTGRSDTTFFADLALADFSQAALIRPNVDTYIGRGLARQLKDEWRASIADFDAATKLEPHNIEALRHRALAWIKLDEIDKAVGDCNRLVYVASQDAEAHSLRCFALGLKGKFDEAMLACNTAIKIDPELASAYMHHGTIWAAKRDDVSAKADYDEAIRLGNDDARSARARILFQQGKLKEATGDLTVLIRMHPKNDDLYLKRATAFYHSGEMEQAITDLDKVIELNPTVAEAFAKRGTVRAERDELTEAVKDFNAAIDLAPDEAGFYILRARLYSQVKRYRDAIVDLTTYLRLVPNDVSAHVHRGLARYFSGDLDDAISDFDAAIEQVADAAELYIYRGSALNQAKDLDRAIVDFSRAIELEPNSAKAYAYRGVAWNAKNESEKALSDFNAAVRLAPDFEIGLVNRGSYWLEKADYGKALDDFRAALRVNPELESVLNEVAWIMATAPATELRDGSEAVKLATRACVLTEWKNHAYLSTLAASYAETGNFESAVQWQTKSLQLASDDAKQEAKKRLDLFKKRQLIRQ